MHIDGDLVEMTGGSNGSWGTWDGTGNAPNGTRLAFEFRDWTGSDFAYPHGFEELTFSTAESGLDGDFPFHLAKEKSTVGVARFVVEMEYTKIDDAWAIPLVSGFNLAAPDNNLGGSWDGEAAYARAVLTKILDPAFAFGVAAMVQNESTLERSFYNEHSELIRTETYLWTGASGSVNQNDWVLLEWENRVYDDHRLIEISNSRGLTETRAYYPDTSPHFGQLISVTDTTGVTTTYTHDALDRVVTATTQQEQIQAGGQSHTIPARTTTTVYDGDNREIKTLVNGVTTSVRRFDHTGRLIAELDGDGDGFKYDRYTDLADRKTTQTAVWGESGQPGWQNLHIASNPEALLNDSTGRTTITQRYRDGSIHIVEGSAVTREEREFTVDAENTDHPGTVIFEEIKRGPPEEQIITRTGRDMVGRVTFTEEPSFTGGVVRTTRLYEHDRESTGPNGWEAREGEELTHGGSGQVSRVEVEHVPESGSPTQMTAPTSHGYDNWGRLQKTTLEIDQSPHTQPGDGFTANSWKRETTREYGHVNSGGQWWREEIVRELFGEDSDPVPVAMGRIRDRVSFDQSGGITAERREWTVGDDTSLNAATETVTEVDPTNKVTVKTVTQPGGRTTEIWSAQDLVFVESEPGAGATVYEYDDQWRIEKVSGPRDVEQEERVYVAPGGSKLSEVKGPTDADGNPGVLQKFTYESASSGGRLRTEEDEQGNKTHYEYNERDQVVHTWGTKVNPLAYVYDNFGRRTKMTAYRDEGPEGTLFNGSEWPDPTGGDETTWTYDSDTGLLTEKMDAKGKITEYGYDEFNRQNARLLPTKRLKRTIYNEITGEVFAEKFYEDADNLGDTGTSDNNTTDVFYSYNRLGKMDRIKDATGERDFSYEDAGEPADRRGLLHSETVKVDGADYVIEYDYDSARRRLSELRHALATDTAMLSMEFGYRPSAPVGLLNSITAKDDQAALGTFTYGYLPDTSWVQTVTSGDYVHTRTYEPGRNMVSGTESDWISTALGTVTHIRDSLGRITTLDREDGMYDLYSGGGIRQTFEYTSKGELKSAQTSQFGSLTTPMPGRALELSYDGQGNRKTLHIDGALSHDYTPGAANEYTEVSYGAHTAWVSGMAVNPGQVVVGDEYAEEAERQEGFFYRGFNARTAASWSTENVYAADQPAPGGFASTYSRSEKEVYLPPAEFAPTYDEAGNLTEDGWWEYEYDGKNRLIRQVSAIARSNGWWRELIFEYDYLGRRTRKTVSSLENQTPGPNDSVISDVAFVYWEWHLLAEVDLTDSSPYVTRSYTWGLDKEGVRPGAGGVGGLLMITDHSTSKSYYAMNDYLGNVIGMVDTASGNIAAAYEYDPFGRELRATGSYAASNPFRFSSQYTDTESGLVYFGFRYYHPQWGRFLNRDPIEEAGGNNLYRFVSNDPVNRWDLLGLAETQQSPEAAWKEREAGWMGTGMFGSSDQSEPSAPQQGRSSNQNGERGVFGRAWDRISSAGRTVANTATAAAEGIREAPQFWTNAVTNAIVDPTAPGGRFIAGIEGAGMGVWAFADGVLNVVPMMEIKPFERYGLYDSSQYGLGLSQSIGGLTRDAALVFGGAAAWRAMPMLGGGSMSTQVSLGLSGAGITPLGALFTSATASSNAAAAFGYTSSFAATQAMRVSTIMSFFD